MQSGLTSSSANRIELVHKELSTTRLCVCAHAYNYYMIVTLDSLLFFLKRKILIQQPG